MKTYRIEEARGFNADNTPVWVPCGTLKGKKLAAVLRRAFYTINPTSNYETRRVEGNTVYHAKYRDIPVLRVVEL